MGNEVSCLAHPARDHLDYLDQGAGWWLRYGLHGLRVDQQLLQAARGESAALIEIAIEADDLVPGPKQDEQAFRCNPSVLSPRRALPLTLIIAR